MFQTCPNPALESGTGSGLPMRGQSPHGAGAAGAPLLFIRSGRVNRPGVKVSPEAKRLASRLTTTVTVSAPAPSPAPESGTGSGLPMRGQSPHGAGAAGAPLLFIRSGRVNRPGVKVSPEAKRLVSRLTTTVTVSAPAPSPALESGTGFWPANAWSISPQRRRCGGPAVLHPLGASKSPRRQGFAGGETLGIEIDHDGHCFSTGPFSRT